MDGPRGVRLMLMGRRGRDGEERKGRGEMSGLPNFHECEAKGKGGGGREEERKGTRRGEKRRGDTGPER